MYSFFQYTPVVNYGSEVEDATMVDYHIGVDDGVWKDYCTMRYSCCWRNISSGMVKCGEFIVSFLIILLSIFESTSILFSILICASSFISILFLIPFCISFKKRITANGKQLDEKYYSLFLIFLAILILLLTVFDINWLKPGVLK